MANPSHQSNNARKKGKNRNNNNPDQEEIRTNPSRTNLPRGNQHQGNQNPQGRNKNKHQGKNNNNIRTNFPCALCSEYDHYTHHSDFPNEHLFNISLDDPWYDDILFYLQTQKFRNHLSRDDHRCIHHQAPRYLLIGDILYRRGVDIVLCRCLTIDKVDQVLKNCHSGACGGHLFRMSTAQKIIHAGYFWPILFHDFIHTMKRCDKCQLYSNKARAPPSLLHLVITAGPFCKWGIDFMTCNPPSSNGHKYIVIVVDYFTKWAEAMPTFNNTTDTTSFFFFNHVISHFGVPL
jgi:hypothetical protein